MATTVVELEELVKRYEGDLTTRFANDYLDTKLLDAVGLILGTCPSVPRRLDDGTLLQINYIRIVCDIILRVIRNPDGYSSESEGGAGYGRLPVVASGNLWLTQQDIDLLNGVIRPGKGMPGSIGIGADAGWSK